jgi:hypothetical protein
MSSNCYNLKGQKDMYKYKVLMRKMPPKICKVLLEGGQRKEAAQPVIESENYFTEGEAFQLDLTGKWSLLIILFFNKIIIRRKGEKRTLSI